MNVAATSYQNSISCYTKSQQVQESTGDYANIKKQEDVKILGLTMINDPNSLISYGMTAVYAKESTAENPIIQIKSNYGGKNSVYKIAIKDINPDNASRLEMFALCSYADDQGIGDNSKFGTYQTLRGFEEMSIHNGYFGEGVKGASSFEEFRNVKLNWFNACKHTVDLLYRCNDLIAYKKGKDILNLFSKYRLQSA